MADRRSSWSGLRRTLSVKSISSRWIRSPTRWSTQRGRPGGRVALDHALDDLAGVERPLEGPVGEQLDQRFLTVLGQQRGQHPPDRRSPLRFGDTLDDHPVQHELHVLVAQHLHQHPQHRRGLGGHPLGVRRLREPLAEPTRDLRVAQFGLDDLRRHEVLPDEGAEALAELVFLALDDRGVRDRDAQRMLEQRGDGEPVGQSRRPCRPPRPPGRSRPSRAAPSDCAQLQSRKTTVAPTRKLSATTFIRRSPRRRSASAAESAPASDSAKLVRGADGGGPSCRRSVCVPLLHHPLRRHVPGRSRQDPRTRSAVLSRGTRERITAIVAQQTPAVAVKTDGRKRRWHQAQGGAPQ